MKNNPINPEDQNQAIIMISQLDTPLGIMVAGATEDGLCLLEFNDRPELKAELEDIKRLLNAQVVEGKNSHILKTEQELKEYFEGKRKHFDVSLITPGTDFQMEVWNNLKDIPYGETISYQQQSEKMGYPAAIRAIAHANGCNRISIIIPCHRVIGKNGKLTGYGGGVDRKRRLLILENQYSGNNVGLFSPISNDKQ